MVQQFSSRRAASPERWQAALARAVEHGIEVLQVFGSARFVVTSATRLTTVHETDGDRCSCEAATAGDPVCCHRAVVRSILGTLDPDPEPPTIRALAKQYVYVRPHAA